MMEANPLKSHWYIACQSSQLGSAPMQRIIFETPIVLYRSKDNTPRAFLDQCPHRNMALSKGRVTKYGTLQCAYHGWNFSEEGNCTSIPASLAEAGTHNKICLKKFPVVEKQGFIWVCPEGKPEQEPLDFPLLGEPGARTWVMERVFEGNAFHCVENFLDVPHTVFVHNKWFRNNTREEIEFEVTSGDDWVEAHFLNEKPMNSFLGRLLFPRNEPLKHTDKFTLPYVTRVDYYFNPERHFIVMSQCTPIHDNQCRVFTYMAYKLKFGSLLIYPLYKALSSVILNQDVKVIRSQTDSIRSVGKRSFLFHNTDAIGKEINLLLQGKKITGTPRRGAFLI